MAKKMYEESHIANIAEAIRSTDPSLEFVKYKTSDMAAGVNTVQQLAYHYGERYGYDNGFTDGETHGYNQGLSVGRGEGRDEGIEEGKKDERDKFWNIFQKDGDENGLNYYYAFSYGRFTDENYNPKYDIIVADGSVTGRNIFHGSDITDTKVSIFANAGSANQCFYGAKKLHTIHLFSVHETTVLTQTFQNCESLINLIMGGTIGQDFDIKFSPLLSDTSIQSIIEHLGTVTNKTITFHSDILDKLTTEQIQQIANKGWTLG